MIVFSFEEFQQPLSHGSMTLELSLIWSSDLESWCIRRLYRHRRHTNPKHLEEDFQLTQHINTMCLPDPVFEDDSYDTTNCFATGWGKDKFGKLS